MGEYVIKYDGDLTDITDRLGLAAEDLSLGYAIVVADAGKLAELYAHPRVIDVEAPKELYVGGLLSMSASCIPGGGRRAERSRAEGQPSG